MHYVYCLLINFTLISSVVFGQETVRVLFDIGELSGIHMSSFVADLMPINESKSFVSFGNVKLGLLDNNSGNIIRWVENKIVHEFLTHEIQTIANNKFLKIIPYSEDVSLPSCSQSNLWYNRILCSKSGEYIIDIGIAVQDTTDKFGVLRGFLFMDKELQCEDIIWRDDFEDNGVYISSEFGCILQDDMIYLTALGTLPSFDGQKPLFAKFQLVNNQYVFDSYLKKPEKSKYNIFSPSRFFTNFYMNGLQCIQNGEKLYCSKSDLESINFELTFNLQENIVYTNIFPIGDNRFVGSKVRINKNGSSQETWIVLLDKNFREKHTYYHFKNLYNWIQSIKLIDGTLYILNYKNQQKEIFLEKLILNLND